ncbi:MAG TPA: energy-coupling factor transporter transmembrane protein EcfT [Marmoricola sp.]|nr:energy-coupling factor transporter transmembrane protein EcfT [Marmoricola sp.]
MNALGLYQPGGSPVHRLPAGVKLLLLLVAAAATHWVDRPWRVGVALGLTVLLYAVARLPARLLLAQVRPLLGLAVVLGAFQWWANGWRTAVVVVGVLAVLVLLAALVTLTTRTTAMIDAVVGLCRPLRLLPGRLRVEPDRVGLLLALGIRSVPVVVGLAQEVREAQLARGLGTSPTAFAVPLVVRSLRHADALGEALAARGVDD